MRNWILLSMTRALALTIALELSAALLLGVRQKGDLLTVTLAQVVTNPLLVVTTMTLNLFFGVSGRTLGLVILEPLAVLVEGLLYRRTLDFKKLNPFLLSLLLNAVSFFTGEILNHLMLRL